MLKKIYNSYITNITIYSLIVIFFIADRYLKYIALHNFFEKYKEIIPHLLYFTFTPNYNISFSIPIKGIIINIIIGLIILKLIHLTINSIKKRDNIMAILLTILITGAISNIADRLIYGYVVDYLYIKQFTIFNISDVMISIGTITLIIYKYEKSRKHKLRDQKGH